MRVVLRCGGRFSDCEGSSSACVVTSGVFHLFSFAFICFHLLCQCKFDIAEIGDITEKLLGTIQVSMSSKLQ